MATLDDEKLLAAKAASELILDGMTVGLGTGSTAAHLVKILGERIRNGLRIRAIPTSIRTQILAEQQHIPLVTFDDVTKIDITIDGADEVDPSFQIIKGGGGALLRERIVASVSERFVVVADSSKQVAVLGQFPLPVEVLKFAWPVVSKALEALAPRVTLRRDASGAAYQTDEHNYILDCHFGRIEKPAELAAQIRAMPGVVDQGLFIDYPDVVIFGTGDTVKRHDVTRTHPRRSP